MEHLKALAEVIVCIAIIAAICICAVAIGHAEGNKVDKKDDVVRSVEVEKVLENDE